MLSPYLFLELIIDWIRYIESLENRLDKFEDLLTRVSVACARIHAWASTRNVAVPWERFFQRAWPVSTMEALER
jgi:hypothetical protein